MKKKLSAIMIGLLMAGTLLAATSEVVKLPAKEVQGTGPLPYNYRIIDGHLHAGGHPLNPSNGLKNTDAQVRSILSYLKSKGVLTVIDLENTKSIQKRYQGILDEAGIKRIHVPLNSLVTPKKDEWERIKTALKGKVYVHCKWGADRTGAVIGRYLVEEKGYLPEDAYKAVVGGGSHAGALGGLKTNWFYRNLKHFIFEGPK